MAKYTTQLVADTSQHDKALGKSKQQVYNYQKGVEKSKQELDKFTSKIQGGAVSALSKFAVGIGAGVTALETLEKIVRSSQTTSDAWDATIRGCTSTVNTFFTALATGDFTNINQGLDVLISKGKKAQQALDQLGNTQISYGYFTSKYRAEYSDALGTAKDKTKSQSERDNAVERAKEILSKQKNNVISLTNELTNTLSALGTETNRLNSMTVERFEKVLAIDTLPEQVRTELKERLSEEYKIYQEEIKKLDTAVSRKQTHTGYVSRTGEKTVLYHMKLDELNKKYEEAIDYKTWLVHKDDEQLINATKLLTNIQDANRGYTEMERQLLEITNQTATVAQTTRTALVGSIAEIEERIKNLEIEYKYTTNNESRAALKAEIDALKNEKIILSVAYQPKPLQMAGLPTATPSEPLLDKIEPINIQIPTDTTTQLSNITSEAENAATAIGAIANAFTALGSASEEGGNKALQIFTLTASAISQLIPQIVTLISAKQGEAIASGTASAAKTPYPANILAIASIVGTIAATFAQLPKFANGGIFDGATTIADFNIARVNKGEMILNGSQQSRLFRMLNDGRVSNNSNGGGNVEFVLRGDTLIGLMKNTEKKNRRVI